jgi:hypothetical protein
MARRKKSQGLGDSVEQVLEVTGISKIAKFILGEDCNCDKRKETLNKLFPYKKANCLTEKDYEYLTIFLDRKRNTILPTEQEIVLKIYNRTFNTNVGATQCATCWIDMIDELKKVFNSYEQ